MGITRDDDSRILDYGPVAAAGETIAFGTFPFSRTIAHRRLSLSFSDDAGITRYCRSFGGTTVEKTIAVSRKEYTVRPLPPMHLPEPVTDFLQVKFNEIRLEPGADTVIFVTIPLEIGISLASQDGEEHTIDVFGFVPPKFALYGTATRGILTRIITSEATGSPRPTKNYRECLLRIKLRNASSSWVSVSRVLLYMNTLVFHYDAACVSSCVSVIISNANKATVLCTDHALHDHMTRVDAIGPTRKFDKFCNVRKVIEDNAVVMDMGLI